MGHFSIILALLLSSYSHASEFPKPFTTDYCTNYPEGTRSEPDLWKHCCLFHDLYLWAGGSKKDRLASDRELKSCIEKTGAHFEANLMYMAVRAGSYSPIKYPDMRWGNAWTNRPEFLPLSSSEIELLDSELTDSHEVTLEQRDSFIEKLRSRLE
jgi:hypothetical protein